MLSEAQAAAQRGTAKDEAIGKCAGAEVRSPTRMRSTITAQQCAAICVIWMRRLNHR